MVKLGIHLRSYLDGIVRSPLRPTETPILVEEDFAMMGAYRELVIAVLKTNYGAELIEIMQRETHSLSSGLETSLSPDG